MKKFLCTSYNRMPQRTQIQFAEPPNAEGKTVSAIVFIILPTDFHPDIDMSKEYTLSEITQMLMAGDKKKK